MDLYTSLVRLKQEMNDGRMPPMMELPAGVHDRIDPSFTIGLGALYEDELRGLRCPVRGCGEFHHLLSRHINKEHKAIGGADGVKRLLSIGPAVGLISSTTRAKFRAAGMERTDAADNARRLKAARKRIDHKRRGDKIRRAFQSVGFRNLRDICEAQISGRLIDLQNKLGRAPTVNEAKAEYGATFTRHVCKIWGSWNNAKSLLGLEAYARYGRLTRRDAVLDGLRAWYDAHGELPTYDEAHAGNRTPFIAGTRAIRTALRADSWPKAMQIAASLLDIHGGRYGLPEKKETAA